ncbi:hypothetical protein LSAT2_019359 [Lamellibrachia satsuma]|nr:hypothetical protein LSAT2_019359 [Lamellibrachia satsuma]
MSLTTSTGAAVIKMTVVDKKNGVSNAQRGYGVTTVKTSSSQMTTMTPTTTTTLSTTTTLQQLVVSAGENIVLQLPQSECTLSAYTVPADTNILDLEHVPMDTVGLGSTPFQTQNHHSTKPRTITALDPEPSQH